MDGKVRDGFGFVTILEFFFFSNGGLTTMLGLPSGVVGLQTQPQARIRVG